jgi:hypothetical protein
MSIIYYDIECDFTQIPNHIILNPKISGTAKAIYFYIIMRLRQNKEWEFYDFDIMKHLKEGRDSFRNAKKELTEYGYLVKVRQNIGSDGKYKGCDYAIRKEPITENPTSAKPTTAEPTSENPHTNNNEKTNNINKKQSNKDKDTASGLSQNENPTVKDSLQVQKPDRDKLSRTEKPKKEIDFPQEFVEFYEGYEGKHPSKQPKTAERALPKWRNACKTHTNDQILRSVQEYAEYMKVATWRKKKGVIEWLNGGLYETDWIEEKLQEQNKQQKSTNNNNYGKQSKDYFAIDKKYARTKNDDFLNGYINGK